MPEDGTAVYRGTRRVKKLFLSDISPAVANHAVADTLRRHLRAQGTEEEFRVFIVANETRIGKTGGDNFSHLLFNTAVNGKELTGENYKVGCRYIDHIEKGAAEKGEAPLQFNDDIVFTLRVEVRQEGKVSGAVLDNRLLCKAPGLSLIHI